MGKYEEAIDFFDQVIEKDKNDLTAWQGKGIAFNYLQRHDEASNSFKKAIDTIDSKTFPDKESIKSFLLYQKGLSLLNLEKYEEAIE